MPGGGGRAGVDAAASVFAHAYSANCRRTQIAQSLNDPPNLVFHAHALKSMSLNLGARRMVDLSRQLEELGRSGKLEGAPSLHRELQNAFTQTSPQLLALRNH